MGIFGGSNLSSKIKPLLVVLAPISFVVGTVFMLSFGSGLSMTDSIEDDMENNIDGTTTEDMILSNIAAHRYDSYDYGQFELTKEDLIDILNEVKATKEIRATSFDYQYYWETWCVCDYTTIEDGLYFDTSTMTIQSGPHSVSKSTAWWEEKSEEDIKGSDPNASDFVWGWHCGYRYTDGYTTKTPTRFNGVQLDEYKEAPLTLDNSIEREDEYSVDWQSIYALCVMASQEQISEWKDDWQNDDQEEKIDLRVDADTIEKVIDAFRYEFVYGFDGSNAKNVKETARWQVLDRQYLDENGEPTEEAYKIFVVRRRTPLEMLRQGNSEIRYKCKKIQYEVQEKQMNWNALEKITYVGESSGDWSVEDNGTTVYKRTLRKKPATSLLGVSNSYMYVKLNAKKNTFDTAHGEIDGADKYKKFEQYVEGNDCVHVGSGMTNLNDECEYQNNKQFAEGEYGCNAERFYTTCTTVVNQFDWNLFFSILETLPDSDASVDKYTKIYEEWKNNHFTKRALTEDEFKHTQEFANEAELKDKKIIFGSNRKTEDDYFIPDLDEYSSDAASDRSLMVGDNLTEEQIRAIFNGFSPFAGRESSLFHDDSIVGWLMKFQEKYPDASLIGLISLAACESGYGTSPLCNDYWNFIGWGAFDNAPRAGESQYGNFKKLSETEGDGTVGYALYRCFEKIYLNYLAAGQDSYHTMRWNNGTHQYCTSLTWEFTNANIRAQIEKHLGIESPGIYGGSSEPIDLGTLPSDQAEVIASFGPPLYHAYSISSPFGLRKSPTKGASTNHKGVDLNSSDDFGKPIYAVADGVVTYTGWPGNGTNGSGWMVSIEHGAGVVTRYMHMAEKGSIIIAGEKVVYEAGTHVRKGQIIGYIGETGVGTGPHLHFELMIDGTHVDPLDYMNL